MKHCPDCGKELGAGVAKCSNPDCGAEFMEPVNAETSDPPIKKSDELRQLEMEYQLATRGGPTSAQNLRGDDRRILDLPNIGFGACRDRKTVVSPLAACLGLRHYWDCRSYLLFLR
jgi:hypothetical protein